MIILGIESTCDETSVGIVDGGTRVLANVVASSSAMHEKYGGIVPEVAAREQVKVIVPTLLEALNRYTPGVRSGATWNTPGVSKKIDAIAVAYGPGLIGSLLIGVETAKALALAWNKPLIGVNHLVGHLYANWLDEKGSKSQRVKESKTPEFPAIGLVVSGGHTDLILMKSHKEFKWLGGTLDDAAGEVFDKVARVLGFPYPGGPEIERAARNVKSRISNFKFPMPMAGREDFKFSFSGLKTAVVNYVANNQGGDVSRIAFEFQETVCQFLAKKTFAAAKQYGVKSIVVGGGVSANRRLFEMFEQMATAQKICLYFPEGNLSVDNGAMIASAAYFHQNFLDIASAQANPSLYFV